MHIKRRIGLRRGPGSSWVGIQVYLGGGCPQRVEADLLYFADERRGLEDGEPLVLVECKCSIKDLKAAAGQVPARCAATRCGYLPAYYVITDAKPVSVWDF